jgi:hypothetical protein
MEDYLDDFMTHVEQTDSCWFWKGWKNQRGHGLYVLRKEKTIIPAHRFIYQYFNGSVEKGFVVRHLCRNKCVNPEHLQVGTYKDNAADRLRDGTAINLRGEQHGLSKLKVDDVRAIRASTETQAALAKKYRVAQSLISGIKKKIYWSWVDRD